MHQDAGERSASRTQHEDRGTRCQGTRGQGTRKCASGGPPDGELPAGSDLTGILGRDDDIAVALAGVQVFSTGFLFEVRLLQRRSSSSRHVPPAPTPIRVSYADGSSGEAWIPHGPARSISVAAGSRGAVLVVPRGAGGRPGDQRQELWVSPLPPPGPVEISLPGVETLTPGRVVLPGEALRDAASRAVPLWSGDGGAEPPFDAAFAPALPPAGVAPSDADDAVAAVRAAFRRAFAGPGDDDRFEAVQDGEVLRWPAQEAARRWPEVAGTIRVGLGEVAFLDEARAAVQYQLTWSGAGDFGPQLGYAVRERGSWKVARGTYCRLLDAWRRAVSAATTGPLTGARARSYQSALVRVPLSSPLRRHSPAPTKTGFDSWARR